MADYSRVNIYYCTGTLFFFLSTHIYMCNYLIKISGGTSKIIHLFHYNGFSNILFLTHKTKELLIIPTINNQDLTGNKYNSVHSWEEQTYYVIIVRTWYCDNIRNFILTINESSSRKSSWPAWHPVFHIIAQKHDVALLSRRGSSVWKSSFRKLALFALRGPRCPSSWLLFMTKQDSERAKRERARCESLRSRLVFVECHKKKKRREGGAGKRKISALQRDLSVAKSRCRVWRFRIKLLAPFRSGAKQMSSCTFKGARRLLQSSLAVLISAVDIPFTSPRSRAARWERSRCRLPISWMNSTTERPRVDGGSSNSRHATRRFFLVFYTNARSCWIMRPTV